MAYVSDDGSVAGKLDVYTADANGENKRRLTFLGGYAAYPAWSRDGMRIYFNHERNGRLDVYRLTVGADGGCAS